MYTFVIRLKWERQTTVILLNVVSMVNCLKFCLEITLYSNRMLPSMGIAAKSKII